MAYFFIKPRYSSAFRDAMFGLASLKYDASAPELRITESILYVFCRDGLGRVVGQLVLYRDLCCIEHATWLSSNDEKGYTVSPLNLMEHLKTSMLDLQRHHSLIVDTRLHRNDNEKPLVLLGNHEPISRFTFFFANFQEIAIYEHPNFTTYVYPSLQIPAMVCLNTVIKLGHGVNFHMVISLCTINHPNGEHHSPEGFRLTLEDEIKFAGAGYGQDVDVEVYGLLPLLFGCRSDGYTHSTVIVSLDKCFPLCIEYAIF